MEGLSSPEKSSKKGLLRRFLENVNGPDNTTEVPIDFAAEKKALQGAALALPLLGANPAAALDVSTKSPQSIEEAIDAAAASDRAIKCLTENVYHEARGEVDEGKLAVALVTLARTLSLGVEKFPKDVCGVVYQARQFSWTTDKNVLKRPIDKKRFEPIRALLMGKLKGRKVEEAVTILSMTLGLPVDTLYYKRADWTPESGKLSEKSAAFFNSLDPVKQIGNHVFYVAKKKQ